MLTSDPGRALPRQLGASLAGVAAVLACSGPSAVASERAYELVSPADNLARIHHLAGFSSNDGDIVSFSSGDATAGSIPNGPLPTMDSFMARRTPTGWKLEWVTDIVADEPGTSGSQTLAISEDGSRQLFESENPAGPLDAIPHSVDPFLRVNGQSTWLTPVARDQASDDHRVVATTADLQRVLLTVRGPGLVPEDDDVANDLYLVTPEGTKLVTPGVDGDDVVINGTFESASWALSPDGRSGTMVTAAALVPADTDTHRPDVYRWNESGSYALLSPDRRTTPGWQGAGLAVESVTADGDQACYLTDTQHADTDTDQALDLYCYRASTDELTHVSDGIEANDGEPVRPIAVSKDGSSVFFSVWSQLTADDHDGGYSLYLRRNGQLRYLAHIEDSDGWDSRDWLPGRMAANEPRMRAMRLSDDGTTMTFVSEAQLVPEDTDTRPDVYRWTLDDGFELVSTGPSGGNGAYSATIGSFDPIGLGQGLNGHVVAGDHHERIYFTTAESLVPEDTDQGRIDVYEWRKGEGVQLVTPRGSRQADANYIDNSQDGGTVFFTTGEQVLPEDVNGGVADLYAARIGGGFPSPPATQRCSGDACQGAATVAPALPALASSTVSGSGNVVEPRPRTAPSGRVTVTRRMVGGTTARVQVRVSARGVLTLSGPGVRDVRRTVRAGRTTVTLRLTPAAGRRVARGKDVRTRVQIAFRPAGAATVRTTTTLTFKGKRAHARTKGR